MDRGVEAGYRVRVGEDELAQALAVDLFVGIEYVWTEEHHHSLPALGARPVHLVAHLVCFDDVGAQGLEEGDHRALAHSDAAGEANHLHGRPPAGVSPF